MRAQVFFLFLLAHMTACSSSQPMWKQPKNVSGANLGKCPLLAGDYEFRGITEFLKEMQTNSFLGVQRRPSRGGVESFRVTVDNGNLGVLRVALLDTSGKAVGDDLTIKVECRNDAWEERSQFKGGGEGTYQVGERVWRYSRNNQGDLTVELSESVAMYYLPGIPSHGTSNSVSRFAARVER